MTPYNYNAWDTDANAHKLADAANHTLIMRPSGIAPAALPTEVGHGQYQVILTDAEAAANTAIDLSSSTAFVALFACGPVRGAIATLANQTALAVQVSALPTVAAITAGVWSRTVRRLTGLLPGA